MKASERLIDELSDSYCALFDLKKFIKQNQYNKAHGELNYIKQRVNEHNQKHSADQISMEDVLSRGKIFEVANDYKITYPEIYQLVYSYNTGVLQSLYKTVSGSAISLMGLFSSATSSPQGSKDALDASTSSPKPS